MPGHQLDNALKRAKDVIYGIVEEDRSVLDKMPNEEDTFIPTPEQIAEIETLG